MSPKSTKKPLFIFAGEPSGDLHGAYIMQSLNSKGFELFGVGGPQMREEGMDIVLPMEAFCVMGIGAVIKALPRLRGYFYQIAGVILDQAPHCIILIDYPGFNLRLMRYLRKRGFKGKIIQYVAPTVWAHGKKRARLLEKYADLLLVIYPFEKAYFPGMSVKYVGNPLLNNLKRQKKRKKLIALFPGSREHEIRHNLPALRESALQIQKKRPDLEIAISAASPKTAALIGKEARLDSQRLMEEATLALAVSGTVTLELALKGTPTVVCYHIPRLLYFVARWVARIDLKYFCIVNILMNEEVFPEFYQRRLDAKAIAESGLSLLKEPTNCQKRLKALKKVMGKGESAAEAIEALIQKPLYSRELKSRPR